MAGENGADVKDGDGENNTPEYVTKDELAAMVTGATSRIAKDLAKDLQKSQEKLFADIQEKLKAELPKPADPEATPDPKKPDPKVAAMENQIAELRKTLEAAEAARTAAENKSREDSARSLLRAELAQKLRPEMVDVATKLLFDAERRVSFDEDGTPLFTIKHAPHGMSSEDTAFPLSDGLGQWLKSEEAKLFIPAPNGGSPGVKTAAAPRGQSRALPQYDSPAKTDDEKIQRAMERAAAFQQTQS